MALSLNKQIPRCLFTFLPQEAHLELKSVAFCALFEAAHEGRNSVHAAALPMA